RVHGARAGIDDELLAPLVVAGDVGVAQRGDAARRLVVVGRPIVVGVLALRARLAGQVDVADEFLVVVPDAFLVREVDGPLDRLDARVVEADLAAGIRGVVGVEGEETELRALPADAALGVREFAGEGRLAVPDDRGVRGSRGDRPAGGAPGRDEPPVL